MDLYKLHNRSTKIGSKDIFKCFGNHNKLMHGLQAMYLSFYDIPTTQTQLQLIELGVLDLKCACKKSNIDNSRLYWGQTWAGPVCN